MLIFHRNQFNNLSLLSIESTDVKVRAEIRFNFEISRNEFLNNSEKWREDFENSV